MRCVSRPAAALAGLVSRSGRSGACSRRPALAGLAKRLGTAAAPAEAACLAFHESTQPSPIARRARWARPLSPSDAPAASATSACSSACRWRRRRARSRSAAEGPVGGWRPTPGGVPRGGATAPRWPSKMTPSARTLLRGERRKADPTAGITAPKPARPAGQSSGGRTPDWTAGAALTLAHGSPRAVHMRDPLPAPRRQPRLPGRAALTPSAKRSPLVLSTALA